MPVKRKRKRLKRLTKRKLFTLARTARRKALAEWGRAVRAVGKCAVCGIGEVRKRNPDGTYKRNKRGKFTIVRLNAHHILSKEAYPEFALLAINGIALCPANHKYSKFSAHKNGLWFFEWLKKNRPVQYRWCRRHTGRPRLRLKLK